jgi:hypothetical protein
MAKQPDCSYVPVNLTVPPALGNPITITPQNPLGDPFPTMVFECAYTNEDWARLMNDARTKTFAATTSIQLWIGCKIYKSDRSFRCVWGKRRVQGHNMRIMRTSPRLSMDAPTARVFRIPSSLIYWGCAVPPHVPVDWPLPLNVIRKAVLPRFH